MSNPATLSQKRLAREAKCAIDVITHAVTNKRRTKPPKDLVHRKRENSGVHFGKVRVGFMNRTVAKPLDVEGHIAAIGAPGSGKSSCIVKPTLETCSDPIVAIDINSELYEHCQKMRKPGARPIKVINLTSEAGDFPTYCPLSHLFDGGSANVIQNCRELVQCIAPLPTNVREPFWIEAAQFVVTGLILHYMDEGHNFNDIMKLIQGMPLHEHISGITEVSKSEGAKLILAQFKGIKYPEDNKMIFSIAATITTRILKGLDFTGRGNNIGLQLLFFANLGAEFSDQLLLVCNCSFQLCQPPLLPILQ